MKSWNTASHWGLLFLAALPLVGCEVTSVLPFGEEEDTSGLVPVLTIYSEKDPTATVHSFDNADLGSVQTLILTVRNDGNETAQNMYGGTLSPPYAYTGSVYPGVRGNCGISLAVAEECTIEVSFTPTVYAYHLAEVEIYHAEGVGEFSLRGAGRNALWGDSEPSEPLIQAVLPEVKAKYIGTHDSGARTVTINHSGDSIECSHDGGLNYRSCESLNRVTWSVADYQNDTTIVVRAWYRGKSSSTSFKLRDAYPGKVFETCTVQVTANESATALAARLVSDSVICVNSGVWIRGDNLVGVFSKSNVKLIGTVFDPPTYTMNGTGGLSFSTTENVLIASFAFYANGSVGATGIDLSHSEGTRTSDTIDNVSMYYTASAPGLGYYVSGNREVTLLNSRFLQSGSIGTWGIAASPYDNGGDFSWRPTLVIDGFVGTVEYSHVVGAVGAWVTLTNSTITSQGRGSAYAPIYFGADTTYHKSVTFNASNNLIRTEIWAVAAAQTSGSATVTASFNDNKFVRLGGAVSSHYVFGVTNTGGNPTINGTGNIYCNHPALVTATKFFSVSAGSGVHSGTLSTSDTVTDSCLY